jgi:DNA-binding winged helix-turn-helix (wHTH) protein
MRGSALAEKIDPPSDSRTISDAAAVGYGRRRGDSGAPEASLGRRRGDTSTTSALGRRGRTLACNFAGFRLEADGTLRRAGSVVHLPPKELAALRLLIAHAGQIVSPLQLRQALWGDVSVTADSVPKCLSSLRARLEPEECIQTVYKRGYRFSAPVQRQSAAAAGAPQRLVILPFATLHYVPKHLGQAIAEEAIVRLTNSGTAALSVLARDSVFTLVGRGLTAQQIGEALKANLVLTGSLGALDSQYRLRAEMIRVEDGTQIWVEDFLVEQSRIAGLETELVERLQWRLGVGVAGQRPASAGGELSISAAAAPALEQSIPQRREAYDSYLRGRHEWQSLHRHRMQDGLQHLLRAIESDPSLVSAKIDLVNLCVTQTFYGFMSPAYAAEQIRRTADSIEDLPRQAEAMLPALGWLSFHYDRDLPAALSFFSRSAHLPHGPSTTRVRAMLELGRGRCAQAIELLRAAIQLDPYSAWLQSRLAWALHLDGRAEESYGQIQLALSLFPDHEFTIFYAAMIYAFNGEAQRAVQLAEELAQRVPYFDLASAVHAYALARAGRGDEARVLAERMQWLSRERFLLRSFTPAVYVALGDLDAAVEELEAANESRCPWLFQMLFDPRLKPLHGHPEFERMRGMLAAMEAEAAQIH